MGAGALIFDYEGGLHGTLWSGEKTGPVNHYARAATQTRFAGNSTVGLTIDMNKRFGLRAGYRAVAYLSPDFHTGQPNYKQYTVMQQPLFGMFLKF